MKNRLRVSPPVQSPNKILHLKISEILNHNFNLPFEISAGARLTDRTSETFGEHDGSFRATFFNQA